MPAKKKKSKGSKLTRMNEEEKLRYLQHRAEIELESKRRKQQLISIFTKVILSMILFILLINFLLKFTE